MREWRWSRQGGEMIAPRVWVAGLWGASALFALYHGIAHGSTVAWGFLAALVPSLVVFVWWIVDRSALERRIRRLEARCEIGDERRIDAQVHLSKVERQLHDIEQESRRTNAPPLNGI